MPQPRVFITHQEVFGDSPPLSWVRKVLASYPLAGVLRVFTRILHEIESKGYAKAASCSFLEQMASQETYGRIMHALVNRLSGGAPRILFSEIHLLNFLKETIRHSKVDGGQLERADLDVLLKAYLATHDQIPRALRDSERGGANARLKAIEEDLVRQTLLGLNRPLTLLVPRYWALWVTIPKRLGVEQELQQFYGQASDQNYLSAFLLALSAHAYWFTRSGNLFDATMLRKSYWQGFVAPSATVEPWLSEVSLGASDYGTALQREYERLGRNEAWEYSFLTFQNRPLIQIGEDFYCLSLRLLLNSVADGIYYKMLDACEKDDAKVKRLGGLFGVIVHEYTYKLWESTVGSARLSYLRYGKDKKEAGDGLIDSAPNLLIYDAKSARFKLETARTGKVSLMTRDLEQGVLRAAGQLDSVIRDIQRGSVDSSLTRYRRIYPIVVTATEFPGIPTVDRTLREALERNKLLEMNGVANLQVTDLEGLEILESVGAVSIDPMALLVERGEEERSRAESIKDLIYSKTGKIPENARMKSVFLAMMEGLERWFETGTFDDNRIDRLLFPST